MGQIVGGAAKPKRCNLNKLSQLGTPAAGEHILVSSDNSMNAAGQGHFDSYIIGVGNVAAPELPLHKFKAEELDEQLNGFEKEVRSEITYNRTDGVHWALNSSNNYVKADVNRTIFIPVVAGERYVVVQGADEPTATILGVLKTMPDFSQTSPIPADFATGYTARISIPVGTEYEFVAPEDATYISLNLHATAGDLNPSFWHYVTENVRGFVEITEEQINDIQSQVDDISDEYNAISAEIHGKDTEDETTLDLTSYTQYKTYIYAGSNKWTLNDNAGCVLIPVTHGDTYILEAPSDKKGSFAILKTDSHASGSHASYSDEFPSLISVDVGATQEVTIPSDGNFLYALTKSASSGDIACAVTQIVYEHEEGIKDEINALDVRVAALESGTSDGVDANLAQMFESMPYAIDADGWEVPTTPGMVYALKKAAQASQISYNALAPYPTLSSPTGAAAGEHIGFPYSSTKQIRKFIGWEVSFRTFMTAVQNVYGMFYTEDISYAHGQSGYGYTYDGTNCGPYYAMVCSIFTGWALGFDIPWDTDQFAYLSRIGELVRVNDQTPQGVHICDLVWYQGHCVLVTGVRRDQWGNVINVQITESLGAVHSTNFTAAQFENYLHTTHNCIIYRPTKVYRNTYTPSEFIAVRGESEPTAYNYNYDICHYAGDYSAMRTNQPVWINYTLGNYTDMKIYKDDTLLATISLDGSLHKVDVSSYMTGAGKYSACLTDGTSDSDLTHWQLVDAGCTYENIGTKQRITFNSSNGTPWWVQVCSSRGVAYCWYQPTEEDVANGFCELDLAAMIAEQYTGTPVSTTFVRVMYKADYGGVASEMAQMD